MKTTRERVLLWHRRGKDARWIADKLGLWPSAVYYHLHVLEKNGIITNPVRHYSQRKTK